MARIKQIEHTKGTRGTQKAREATDLALVVLVDGEAAEPVGFGAVGGGGVLLHAAEDVAGHGCSDREGRGTEEHQEEQEADRRGSGGESSRGNAHALVVEYGEVWRLLCFVGGFYLRLLHLRRQPTGNGRRGTAERG